MERIIQLPDIEEARVLFGARDMFLKIIRDACGVSIVARNGLVKIEGAGKEVEHACDSIEKLREVIRRTGKLYKSEVIDIIYGRSPAGEGAIIPGNGRGSVSPRTPGQAQYIKAIRDNSIVFSIGPAGTGKTFLAVATAVEELRRGNVRKIVLVRPVVEAGESLGFLPGDVMDKVNPYMKPLYDALSDLIEYNQIRKHLERNLLEIAPLAYMRGRTLNDAFIILDEAQNTSADQMKMFLTRMGLHSKMVITGDITQIDLPDPAKSGLVLIQNVLKGINDMSFVYLSGKDIVRHPLVQDIVDAYERWNSRQAKQDNSEKS